jgi:SAM-dependent methyltransferase
VRRAGYDAGVTQASPSQMVRVPAPGQDADLAFLGVDRFLQTLVDARALRTAFELGVIDYLSQNRGASFDALAKALEIDRTGLRLLVDLLATGGVLDEKERRLRLSTAFLQALDCRDLLETKLDFAGIAMNDFADHFTEMVRTNTNQLSKGLLFDLFDYRRCFEATTENWQRTRAWMRLTSTLTRYEARTALRLHDFGSHRRMLDVGGNSGEFVLQACRQHPGIRGTVFDLPLVCEIGLEHVLAAPEHARIGFVPGDLRRDMLPAGHDLVTFKSILHDWPQEDADAFLAKAVRALEPGGTLLIFERAPLDAHARPPFAMLPILLFFRSYRPHTAYTGRLAALGMQDIGVQFVQLDTPFFLVTARKPE